VDGPTIEEILPRIEPTPATRRERRRASIFGLPGLVGAILAGVMTGLALGSANVGSAATADASGSPGTSGSPSAGSASTGVAPTPYLSAGPAPSPTRRFFRLGRGSMAMDEWSPAILALMETTPLDIEDVNVNRWGDGPERGEWQISLFGSSDLWAFFGGLEAFLEARGFSDVVTSMGPTADVRYLDGPGVTAMVAVAPQRGTASVWFLLRVSAASTLPDGRLTDDPRSEFERRGCQVDVAAPRAIADLAKVLADTTARITDIGLCPSGSDDGPALWEVAADLDEAQDPVALLDVIVAHLEAAGLRTLATMNAFWDSGRAGSPYGISPSYWVGPRTRPGEADGDRWYVTIGRDGERPQNLRVWVVVATTELGTDGRFRPDAGR
jgi:hypothetical protein